MAAATGKFVETFNQIKSIASDLVAVNTTDGIKFDCKNSVFKLIDKLRACLSFIIEDCYLIIIYVYSHLYSQLKGIAFLCELCVSVVLLNSVCSPSARILAGGEGRSALWNPHHISRIINM